MSSEVSFKKAKRQNRATRTPSPKASASMRSEKLSPKRRAKIALDLTAREQRRRPPSI